MKARLILACAVAGIATSAFGVPSANAESTFSGTIAFTADEAKRGDSVDITGTCNDPAFTTAPVISSILDAPDLRGREDGTGGKSLISHAKVRNDAPEEQIHMVSFKCGTELVTGYLRVAATEKLKPRPARVAVVPVKGGVGDKVSVRVNCADSPSVSSTALAVGSLKRMPEGRGPDLPQFVGTGTVKDIKPGTYKVSAKCGAKNLSTDFTVVGPRAQPAKAQVPVKPKGAAETGEIVSQPLEDASSSTALVLGGVGVLLVAGGVGALAYRRRRRV